MQKREIVDKIALSAMIVFIGMIISKILTYAYRLIVARFLGPEEYGTLTLSLSILYLLIVLSNIAHPSAIVRYASFYKGKNNQEKIQKIESPKGLKIAF